MAKSTYRLAGFLVIGALVLIGGLLLSGASTAAGDGSSIVGTGPDRSPPDTSAVTWQDTLSFTSSYTSYLPLVMAPPSTLKGATTRMDLALPEPLAGTSSSFCVWNWCSISPRLYHEPLTDGRTLVGWTDSGGDGHVSVVGSAGIEQTFDFAARSLRGLVAHGDGSFAVLLYDAGSRVIWLSKRQANGAAIWTTNLNSTIAAPDFWLGGSRLAYGDGLYAAYFTVQGTSGGFTGHYGDQLTYVNDSGVVQSTGWDWGCSHSMAQLVNYHAALDAFIPVCSSDCYASKGILIEDHYVAYPCDGNCAGFVSAQLGQMAHGDEVWLLVFSALNRPCCTGKGIGLATIDGSFGSTFTWLTDTDGTYERDPVIARLGTDASADRFLVGWTTTNNGVYWMAVIDGAGDFIVEPEEVTSAGIAWGNRDDSFRTRPDGTVSWVQGDPGSTTLHLFRFDGASYLP
jgi:hypothetical protein